MASIRTRVVETLRDRDKGLTTPEVARQAQITLQQARRTIKNLQTKGVIVTSRDGVIQPHHHLTGVEIQRQRGEGMRIHTELDAGIIRMLVQNLKDEGKLPVGMKIELMEHGNRSNAHAFEMRLALSTADAARAQLTTPYTMKRRSQSAYGHGVTLDGAPALTGTWTEYGWLFDVLFTADPKFTVPSIYPDREAFDIRTAWVFDENEYPKHKILHPTELLPGDIIIGANTTGSALWAVEGLGSSKGRGITVHVSQYVGVFDPVRNLTPDFRFAQHKVIAKTRFLIVARPEDAA